MSSTSVALYRSLLRSSRVYGQSPALCSLLHRTGRADLWDPTTEGPYRGGPDAAASGGRGGNGGPAIPDEELQSIHLPPDSARDLSRGYDDLRRSHYHHSRAADRGQQLGAAAESDDVLVEGEASDDGSVRISIIRGDELEEIEEFNLHELEEGSSRNSRTRRRPSHEVLFRKLLQDLLGGGDAQMCFPSHVVANDDSQRLEEIIRREFRAPSLGEWNRDTSGETEANQNRPPTEVSAYFTDTSRREAAFLALRELNKKLVWAESTGMQLGKNCKKSDSSETKRQYRQQAAKNVEVLPTSSPSSYLRAGTFLVAHPLLSGYFANTVIAILEHTEPHIATKRDAGSDGSDGSFVEGDQYGNGGGTYGVIVNRSSFSSIPNESGVPRPRALREVLRPDCIPPILRRAFGDSIVREGGPVNVSVQMMHTASPELEEELKLGGMVLPMVLSDDRDEQVGEILSAAADSDSAVYFNSDLIKAAQSVIDGKMERDDFSFFVGASVWTVGQLQREIEQGFWIPCHGPPQMAYSGMCEHCEVEREDEKKKTETDAFRSMGDGEMSKRKKTQSRPRPDLWLSMLSAVGEHEAELAELVGQEEVGKDPNSKACDWW
mmetsp:Transcript_662/g.1867  ORF Transcript_662/g.1867 Transcript_662/m.1867 type:complete len:606 (-) Transcript_662:89-1906(-)